MRGLTGLCWACSLRKRTKTCLWSWAVGCESRLPIRIVRQSTQVKDGQSLKLYLPSLFLILAGLFLGCGKVRQSGHMRCDRSGTGLYFLINTPPHGGNIPRKMV